MEKTSRHLPKVLLLLALALMGCPGPQSAFHPGISQEELFAHVDFLASDSLQGRPPGTPFDRVSAKYIKDHLEASGVRLMGKNGYQFFEFIGTHTIGPGNTFQAGGRLYRHGEDYTLSPLTSSDSATATAVFVGYGITATAAGIAWDDYQSVSLLGRWAIALRGAPRLPNNPLALSSLATDRHKALLAREHGAVGVILVAGPDYHPQDMLPEPTQMLFDVGIPVIYARRGVVDQILHRTANSIGSLEKRMAREQRPVSFQVPEPITIRTDVEREIRTTQNVVGLVEGADPALRSQYVVIGAHYDHLGLGGAHTGSRAPDALAVHNGANDNASGVAALLEIAQKLTTAKPSRSIVLIAFGAEELGLLGSRYFADNPLVPLDSISAMINLDMLGRWDGRAPLQVGGVGSSVEAQQVLIDHSRRLSIPITTSHSGHGPSDHASFYAKGVPVTFFTTGADDLHHTPHDKTHTLNFKGLQALTQFVYHYALAVANLPNRLTFRPSHPPIAGELPYPAAGMGIVADRSQPSGGGIPIAHVIDSSPAAHAGLAANDIIVAVNGTPVGGYPAYQATIRRLAAGRTVTLEVLRRGERLIVLVQL